MRPQKFFLVGGLGHTDLSGKVPKLGLLMLRQALKDAGHEAVVANYAMSLNEKIFPPSLSAELIQIYNRSVKPFVNDGEKAWQHPLKALRFGLDISRLRQVGSYLLEHEKTVFQELAEEIARQIETEGFDAVGFSLYLGSSTTGSIIIADILRQKFPRLPIFFGGPQTTHFYETIYRETQAPTALVIGEGETAIVELASRLDRIREGDLQCMLDIPNLCYQDESGKLVLTQRQRLTTEDWIDKSADVYQAADFHGLLRHAFIETSRGCSNMCRFCSQPLVSGTERYLKPASKIVDEMLQLYRELGINKFEFVGSSTPPSQAEQVADELISRGLEDAFSWVLFMRGRDESVRTESKVQYMNKMKRAGCSAIFFGVEAADNQTLEKMGKNETIEEIKESLIASRDAGIGTIGSFIYPYPGMPVNSDELIISFLEEVRPLSAPVQPLGLYPGTWCGENAEESGCEVIYPRREDWKAYLAGKKEKPSMDSPEVLRYLLKYPLILSLPMRFWPPFPYKIDGQTYRQYQKKTSSLQKQIAKRGILLGFSHSHYLMAETLGMPPSDFSERMFYCSLTGDGEVMKELVEKCNE
ncbi:MAG: B12-binding domain-containing radical SAM protein [Verrucomicrobiota bacterium]